MRLIAAVACAIAMSSGAGAQTLPPGTFIEAVASVASSSNRPDDPFVFLDLATTWHLGDGIDVVVRPYARRLPGGDWDALLYQAQVRYQPTAGVRVEAGIITSPLGLGALELRPDLNPTVGYPFYYFAPLPQFDEFSNRVQILAGGYPLGAVVSWSGTLFDARMGVTDGTPARYRKVFGGGPPPMPQLVAGGGITPLPGLRLGAGFARGKYRRGVGTNNGAYDSPDYADGPGGAGALVLNIEAEYAFRHTRLSGEWVRDRFETQGAPAVARGFYLQAVQTLTPRTFAAARVTRASSPVQAVTRPERLARTVAEVTGGYRLTPELTLRAGYQRSQPFGMSGWDHAAVGSIVLAKRWF